jgi:hypothetical protein
MPADSSSISPAAGPEPNTTARLPISGQHRRSTSGSAALAGPRPMKPPLGVARPLRQRPGAQGRAPKIAVPTRTIVAPSAIAHSKSCDMPMDSSRKAASSPNSARSAACSVRRRA